MREPVAWGIVVIVATSLLWGCSDVEDTDVAPAPFPDFALTSEMVELLPTGEALQRVVAEYPDRPVVMVNMLQYRDQAEGLDEELTGEEAYAVYAETAVEVLESLGGRVLWAGHVDSHVVGTSEIEFHELALAQYPSGEAFLQLASDPRTASRLQYRAGGLIGQWLLASSGLRPARGPIGASAVPGDGIGDLSGEAVAEWSMRTGFSEAQVRRLLDGPADVPVSIFELLLYRETSGREAYSEYASVFEEVAVENGALVRWAGSGDSMVFGVSDPVFDEVLVTEYPSRRSVLDVLSDPRVVAASQQREAGLRGHWVFASTEDGGTR